MDRATKVLFLVAISLFLVIISVFTFNSFSERRDSSQNYLKSNLLPREIMEGFLKSKLSPNYAPSSVEPRHDRKRDSVWKYRWKAGKGSFCNSLHYDARDNIDELSLRIETRVSGKLTKEKSQSIYNNFLDLERTGDWSSGILKSYGFFKFWQSEWENDQGRLELAITTRNTSEARKVAVIFCLRPRESASYGEDCIMDSGERVK